MNAIQCVKRASVLGYCMGVRKAVEAVMSALDSYTAHTVYTYGPLIHNPATMQFLTRKGVKILDTEAPLAVQIEPESPVIIRAHGIAPQKRQELIDLGCIIIDATCPRVIASQKRAAHYAANGYTVILAGDKNHGEIKSIAGYVDAAAQNRCIVLQNALEAQQLPYIGITAGNHAVLLAQTTIKRSEYEAIAAILLKKNPSLKVLHTICPATSDRQQALVQLTNETDAVLIIGGRESANTRRLLQTAQESGKPAWLIETADEIPKAVYTYQTVGIAAGASTPDMSIDSVEAALVRMP
ncbi:MAG: 4-hydroxy-3-methylbut-2-enyl diphosphate reductase [Treponema sp.]